MGIVQEFKEFAVKGNAVDMAVGIIIGTAFNKIVNSMVNDVLMPPLGMLMGRVDFKDLAITLQKAVPERVAEDGTVIPAVAEVSIRYGMFIQTCIDFLIVAWVVFLMVKFMNRLIRKREAAAAG
jgi:large conductance mechanosensitive channel